MRSTPFRPIYVVSGGMGTSGDQIVRTALAQFAETGVPVEIFPKVRTVAQIDAVVGRAGAEQGTIVHTLVDVKLRRALIRRSRDANVFAVDLLGHLLSRLAEVLGREPIGQPGLYRQLRESYFSRVEAIEFTVGHDDGKRVDELGLADIVLTGPSRVGKTPLSIYLSVLGWKVANVPLLARVEPPSALFEVDRTKVVGLTLDPTRLLTYRRRRQKSLGVPGSSNYTDPVHIDEEVGAAELIFRRGRFSVIDVTEKPIEESADEVIVLVTRKAPPVKGG